MASFGRDEQYDEENYMRATVQIDMVELYEYQDELNSLIKQCEKINEKSELMRDKLFNSGVPVEHLNTVFEILENGV